MREYLIIISFYFSLKPYVVTPHLNRLIERVHTFEPSHQDGSDEGSHI